MNILIVVQNGERVDRRHTWESRFGRLLIVYWQRFSRSGGDFDIGNEGVETSNRHDMTGKGSNRENSLGRRFYSKVSSQTLLVK